MSRFRIAVIFSAAVTILCQQALDAQQIVGQPTRSTSFAQDATTGPRAVRRQRTSSHIGTSMTNSRTARANYVPRHMRQEPVPEIHPEAIDPVGPGIPIQVDAMPMGSGFAGDEIGAPVDEVINGDWAGDSCYGCGGRLLGDDCDRCRPECWIDALGGVLCNAEYFVGAQSYQALAPVDNGFGFYGGFNVGLPLNYLTCGLFSGQFGMSTMFSDLDQQPNGTVNQQLFTTAGLFRRVDYGLQGGVVADILDVDWFSDPRVVQVRSELSWAYPGGCVLGFRSAVGVQDYDDPQNPTFYRTPIDQYRFFCRQALCSGGYTEFQAGWTSVGRAILAADFDVPVADRIALRSGFTYLIGNADNQDAYNIFVGLSFRPRGLGWYDYYHRPMFSVADNGSLILSQ